MRPEHARIKSDPAYPVGEEPRILSGGKALVRVPLRGEEKFALLPVCHPEVIVDRLPGLLCHFEAHRPPRLLLPDCGPLNGVAVWGNVLDLESDHVATT